MVTYDQLNTEAVYRAEVETEQMKWLVSELCKFFGVPRINGGIRGDNRHLNGGHRSQRWILLSQFCTNRTYSAEANLPPTNWNDIAAFDVTLPDKHMLTISRNADRAVRSGQLEELVEWFGNLFNDSGSQKVDGYDNIRNRIATSDSSHLWHFHGRINRWLTRSWDAVRKIYAALTGTAAPITEEEDMGRQLLVRPSDSQQVWKVDGQFRRRLPAGLVTDNKNNHSELLLGALGNGGAVYNWPKPESEMDYWGIDLATLALPQPAIPPAPVGRLELTVTGTLVAEPEADASQ